ncbi:MAG: TraR/DksA family transcriptional regulator [Thermodesulfovibrionales bacterium]|jgi:DnaK suppressor protein
MNDAEDRFDGIRKKLIGLRQGLIRESKAEIVCILTQRDHHDEVSDDGDLADIAVRDSVQATQLTRHQSQLKAVERALSRIEEGTYGICEDCEGEIPIGRLNAMPFAVRCVECQARHEIMTDPFSS